MDRWIALLSANRWREQALACAYVFGNGIAGKAGESTSVARANHAGIPFARRPKQEPWCRVVSLGNRTASMVAFSTGGGTNAMALTGRVR